MKDSELRPFQRTFIKKALAPSTVIGALSMARSVQARSALCAHIARRALTPSETHSTSEGKRDYSWCTRRASLQSSVRVQIRARPSWNLWGSAIQLGE